MRRRHRLTRHTSACFRSRAPGPVSGQLYERRPVEDRSQRFRFPVAFQPPAFASWASCSRPGIKLSLRSAYHDTTGIVDLNGVSTFHTRELRPGRVPSVSRRRRCSCGHRNVLGRRLPTLSGWPLIFFGTTTRPEEFAVTRHQRGFTGVHPSGLPLTCGPRTERGPLGFSLSFAPDHCWPRTSGRGPVMNTDRELRLRHMPEPPIDVLTHSVRPRVATLIGMCGCRRAADGSNVVGLPGSGAWPRPTLARCVELPRQQRG